MGNGAPHHPLTGVGLSAGGAEGPRRPASAQRLPACETARSRVTLAAGVGGWVGLSAPNTYPPAEKRINPCKVHILP